MENIDTPANNPRDAERPAKPGSLLLPKKKADHYHHVFCQGCGYSGRVIPEVESCPACASSGSLKAIGEGLNTIEGGTGQRE